MKQLPEIFFPARQEWRNWLSENYDNSEGVWMIFHNKKSGLPTLTYDEFVEEALCFGWIDSTLKNIDENSFRMIAIPRKNLLKWSHPNRKRVEKLIAQGLMTEAGLNKIGNYAKTGKLIWPEEKKVILPEAFSDECFGLLKQNSEAYTNFSNMAASHQKRYIQWVMSAKQDSTRLKRMNEAVELLKNNHKNLMK